MDRLWIDYPLQYSWASLVAQLVEDLPAMSEIWDLSLGLEDPLCWSFSGLEPGGPESEIRK